MKLKRILISALWVVLLPVLVVYAIVYIFLWFVWGYAITYWFRWKYSRNARDVLFVYSNSSNWQKYIEEHILPRIRERALVLNWSERKQWAQQFRWEARVFRYYAGSREFNPIAIVIRLWWPVRVIRFFKPFRDFKHGKEEALRNAEAELFDLLQDPNLASGRDRLRLPGKARGSG